MYLLTMMMMWPPGLTNTGVDTQEEAIQISHKPPRFMCSKEVHYSEPFLLPYTPFRTFLVTLYSTQDRSCYIASNVTSTREEPGTSTSTVRDMPSYSELPTDTGNCITVWCSGCMAICNACRSKSVVTHQRPCDGYQSTQIRWPHPVLFPILLKYHEWPDHEEPTRSDMYHVPYHWVIERL